MAGTCVKSQGAVSFARRKAAQTQGEMLVSEQAQVRVGLLLDRQGESLINGLEQAKVPDGRDLGRATKVRARPQDWWLGASRSSGVVRVRASNL